MGGLKASYEIHPKRKYPCLIYSSMITIAKFHSKAVEILSYFTRYQQILFADVHLIGKRYEPLYWILSDLLQIIKLELTRKYPLRRY